MQLAGKQSEPAEERGRAEDHEQRRQNAPRAPPVKLGEAEAVLMHGPEDELRDEVARDDEESDT